MTYRPAACYLAVRKPRATEWQLYPTDDEQYARQSQDRINRAHPKWETLLLTSVDGRLLRPDCAGAHLPDRDQVDVTAAEAVA